MNMIQYPESATIATETREEAYVRVINAVLATAGTVTVSPVLYSGGKGDETTPPSVETVYLI